MLHIGRRTYTPVVLEELEQHADGEVLVRGVLYRHSEQLGGTLEVGGQLVGELLELGLDGDPDGKFIGTLLVFDNEVVLEASATALFGNLEHHILAPSLIVDQ